MSDQPPSADTCASCGTALVGVYCHACGQGHQFIRLRSRALADDVVDGLMNLDSRVFRTLWGLTVRPGKVIREYLDGRRIVYVNPFKYAIAAYTVAFLLIPWIGEAMAAPPSALPVEWEKLIAFAALPVMAGVLVLSFRRSGLRWIEHYVLLLFALGHVALLQALFTPVTIVLPGAGTAISLALGYAWLAWSLRVTTGAGWIASVARAILAFAVVQALAAAAIYIFAPELLLTGRG